MLMKTDCEQEISRKCVSKFKVLKYSGIVIKVYQTANYITLFSLEINWLSEKRAKGSESLHRTLDHVFMHGAARLIGARLIETDCRHSY